MQRSGAVWYEGQEDYLWQWEHLTLLTHPGCEFVQTLLFTPIIHPRGLEHVEVDSTMYVDFLCGEQLIKSGEGDALQLWIWKAISGNWSTLTDWFSRWGTNLKGYFWKWSIKRMVIQSLGGYEGWVLSMGVGARGRRSLSPLASPAGRDNDPGQERSTPPSFCFSFFSTLWIKGTTWTRCRRSFYWFKGGITRHSPHFESASPPPIASWGKSTRGWI